jgi:hypothetical protein
LRRSNPDAFSRRESGLLRCARNDGARGVGVAFTTRTSLADTSVADTSLVDISLADRASRLPTRLRVLAASFARALLVVLALFWKRAQGRPGARCSHDRLCARMRVHLAQAENHRAAETSRPSLRDGFTAYIALSPGSDALLPPSPCERSQDLAHSLSGARTTRFCRTLRPSCMRDKSLARRSRVHRRPARVS